MADAVVSKLKVLWFGKSLIFIGAMIGGVEVGVGRSMARET